MIIKSKEKSKEKKTTRKSVPKVIFEVEKNGKRSFVVDEKASFDFMKDNSISRIGSFEDISGLLSGVEFSDIQGLIETAQQAYKINGAFSGIVDFLTNLTNSGFIIHRTGDDEVDKKYLAFAKYLNHGNINSQRGLSNFTRSLIKDFYKCGNSFAVQERPSKEIDGVVHFKSNQGEFIKIKPEKVKILNPSKIAIEDSQISDEKFSYQFNQETISEKGFYHISDKQDYEKFGTPLFAKIAFSLYSYFLARIMDNSSIDGLINSMMIVEIPEGLEDSTDTIVENIMNGKRANMASVVNEGVKVYFVGSKGKIEEMGSRINDSLLDVFNNAGISQAIMTGQGDLDVDALIPHIMKIITEVESNQRLFLPAIEDIISKFAENNGIKIIPKIGIVKSSLRLLLLNKHILQLFDRGLLSGVDTISEAGYSIEDVLYSFDMQEENEMKKNGFLTPSNLPYYANGNPSINKDPNETPGVKTNTNPLKDKK